MAKGVSLEAHVFSEGSEEQFPELSKVARLHMALTSYESFELMIHSDVLVMGSSSFSYVAALLHAGAAVITNGNNGSALQHRDFQACPSWQGASYPAGEIDDCPALQHMLGQT
jgi:hypothetical protein